MQKTHILVPRPNMRGMPGIMFCKILLFMWASGALVNRAAAVDEEFVVMLWDRSVYPGDACAPHRSGHSLIQLRELLVQLVT